MKRILLITVIAIMTAVSLFAQSKMSNRTRVIATAVKNNRSSQSPSLTTLKSVNNVDYITVFVRFNGAIDASVIEKYGGQVRTKYPETSIVTANVPVSALEALAADENIAYIEASQKTRTKMDQARSASNAQKVFDGVSPLPHAFKGNGVIVGIVDQEIQVSHINFWNEDKTRYRIKSFWNQNKNGSGGFGYTYGRFFTDSASILAAGYDMSSMESGHATHVTGIAAGADHSLDYYGMAGEADIVITSTTGEDADLTDGAQYIFHYADSVGKPCVINISMGGELGPHDGTDLCSSVLEGLVKPGNVIIGAAGNSGGVNVHLGKDFTPEDSIAGTFIELMYEWWMPYAMMEAWGEEGNDFEFAIVAYSPSGDSIFYSTPFFRASQDTSFRYRANVTGTRAIKFSADIASGINPLNNKPNIAIEYEQDDVSSSLKIGVLLRSDSGHVDLWCNDYCSAFTDNGYASRGWMSGDDAMSIGEGIAISKKVVAVASYVNKAESYDSTKGDISYFSSRGPSADGRLKPEIAAPGEGVYSSLPDKLYYSYGNEYTTYNGKKYYYGSMSGTSMACPYVTGVVATWLEANPNLDYDDLIDIFAHTAKKDNFTGSDLPDYTWGYGKIDAYEGLMYILGYPEGIENVTDHQIVAIYPNPTVDLFTIGFASADNNVTVSVYDLSGRQVMSASLGNVSAGEERTFSLDGVPTGIYTVRIAGAKQSKCYKLVKQ